MPLREGQRAGIDTLERSHLEGRGVPCCRLSEDVERNGSSTTHGGKVEVNFLTKGVTGSGANNFNQT